MSLLKIFSFITFLLVGVYSQNSTRDSCMKVDNKISICRAFPSMPIEEYQNYCPDNYKVCNLRNLADMNYLAVIGQKFPCTVTNIVESRGTCDSCNPDDLRTSLVHLGSCSLDSSSRSLQFSDSEGPIGDTIQIPIPRLQLENMPPLDFIPFNFQETLFMLNRTILMNMKPEDTYQLSQPYIDSTGRFYKVIVKVIFDIIPTFMPSFMPRSEVSLTPSVRPTPLSQISFDSSISFTPRPSQRITDDIINGISDQIDQFMQGSCYYNGAMLRDGQMIRNERGLCTCMKGNMICQSSRCIQSTMNTFVDSTVSNMDKCISSPRTMAVACCRIPEITCSNSSFFNKETYTCEPLRICVNGIRTSDNQCECSLGYFGKNCEKNCRIDVCFNHGSCSFVNETVKCNCDSGWTGDFCRIPSLPDFNLRCQNGYPDIVNKICRCFPGFFGNVCQNEVPCIFGRVNSDNKCVCNSGYSGSKCDIRMIRRDALPTNIPTISSPKPTLNRCFRGEYDGNLLKCICEHGWSGNTCEENMCFMGHYDINTDACQCRQGWVGRTCNINCRQECNWHGSICKANNTGVCMCDNKWTGNSCEIPDISKLDIKNLDKLEIKISESEGINISTRISNFNFSIKSEVCMLDNCLPISFEFRNMTRTYGRILQSSSPITINYQVEPNMTLQMVNSQNSCSVSQSYSSGVLNAQPSCDGTYNLLVVSSVNSISNPISGPSGPSSTPQAQSNSNNLNNYSDNTKYWGFAGLGVGIIGIIALSVYISRRNKAKRIHQSAQVVQHQIVIQNPINPTR